MWVVCRSVFISGCGEESMPICFPWFSPPATWLSDAQLSLRFSILSLLSSSLSFFLSLSIYFTLSAQLPVFSFLLPSYNRRLVLLDLHFLNLTSPWSPPSPSPPPFLPCPQTAMPGCAAWAPIQASTRKATRTMKISTAERYLKEAAALREWGLCPFSHHEHHYNVNNIFLSPSPINFIISPFFSFHYFTS